MLRQLGLTTHTIIFRTDDTPFLKKGGIFTSAACFHMTKIS